MNLTDKESICRGSVKKNKLESMFISIFLVPPPSLLKMISATCFQDNYYCIFLLYFVGPPQPTVNPSLTNVLPQYQAQRPALNGGNNSLQRPGGPSTTSFGPAVVSKNLKKVQFTEIRRNLLQRLIINVFLQFFNGVATKCSI